MGVPVIALARVMAIENGHVVSGRLKGRPGAASRGHFTMTADKLARAQAHCVVRALERQEPGCRRRGTAISRIAGPQRKWLITSSIMPDCASKGQTAHREEHPRQRVREERMNPRATHGHQDRCKQIRQRKGEAHPHHERPVSFDDGVAFLDVSVHSILSGL